MRHIWLPAAAAAAAMLAAGCGTQPAPHLPLPRFLHGTVDAEPSVSATPYAAADEVFGLDLLHAWCARNPASNIVFSPASLASGLGMAYLGARGDTATAIASVLHLPGPGSLVAGLHARSAALRALDGPGVTVSDSDQVWADPSLAPLTSYLDAVATAYGAGVGQAPLLTNTAKAAALIDAAIAAATRGHITRLLSPQALGDAIFVLTDALYLKAAWATPFVPAKTYDGTFATATGQRVQARYLDGGGYVSAIADGWTAVSLPYRGDRLTMTALLPPAVQAMDGCQGLTASVLASVMHALGSRAHRFEASVDLPEVSLSSQQDMNKLLTQLGMGIAFSQDQADFTGISPSAGPIGHVVHAATLRVSSAGTLASAATAVTLLPTAAYGGPTISFSRPYLMLITATKTGEPLFLASVANPDLH
jgi:serine protease inhibitor